MTTQPQDDLTAERAAKLAAFELVKKLTNNAGMDPNDRWDKVNLLLAYRQTARQAALREAASKVRDRALLWGSHGGAKIGFPYGHLTIEGEYESMADELDRLASEGA